MDGQIEIGGLLCSQVLERLSAYLDGELPAVEVHAVELHLRGCPNCARFGASVQAVISKLRSEGATEAPLETGIERRLWQRLDGRGGRP